MVRRFVSVGAAVFLLAGCGGGEKRSADTVSAAVDRQAAVQEAVWMCLTRAKFSVRSLPTRVTGATPTGARYAITFYGSAERAKAAATANNGRAVANAVVVTRATPKELAVVERCIRSANDHA